MVNMNPSSECRYHQLAGGSDQPALDHRPIISRLPPTVVPSPRALPTLSLDHVKIVPKIISSSVDYTVGFLPTLPELTKKADGIEAEQKESMLEEAEKSLKAEQTRARQLLQNQEDREAWNPGGSKTTGICAAYACKAVEHVIRFGNQEAVPPLVIGSPTKEMQYLVMKLVQSVYLSLRDRERYEDAKLDAEGQQLFNRSLQKFIVLLREQTGLEAVNRYPAEGADSFTTSYKIEDITHLIDEISQKDQGKHHFLFFRNPDAHLSEGHVVYVNFEKGIIGDGGDGTMWKIPAAYKNVFPQVLTKYIKENYGEAYKMVSTIVVNKSFNPKKFPLVLRKMKLYSSLFYLMTKREGIKAACAYTILPAFIALQRKGKKALTAAKKKMILVADIFKLKFGRPDSKQRILDKACKEGDVVTMRLALRWGANPNLLYQNILPLAAAVRSRNMEAIRMLVNAGAQINPPGAENKKNPFGLDLFSLQILIGPDLSSPLSAACSYHCAEIVEYLLSQGAVPKVSDLLSACSSDLLLVCFPGCDLAESESRNKILQMLLARGIDPNDPALRYKGYPLKKVVKRNDLQSVQLLLKYGAKPDVNKNEESELDEAIKNATRGIPGVYDLKLQSEFKEHAKQIACLLVKAGADISNLTETQLESLKEMVKENEEIQVTIAKMENQRKIKAELQASKT